MRDALRDVVKKHRAQGALVCSHRRTVVVRAGCGRPSGSALSVAGRVGARLAAPVALAPSPDSWPHLKCESIASVGCDESALTMSQSTRENAMSHAVGIDISQRTLEVCPGHQVPSRTFANTAVGIAATLTWLHPMEPSRIVFEASGGYEAPLMHAVIAKGWPACRINAQRIHHFAKALGQHAKTDPVDAAVLQRFGDLIEPAGCVLPDLAHAKLLSLVKRRTQLVAMQTGEINRHHQGDAALAASQDRMRKAIKREITHIEKDIARCIGHNDAITKQVKLLSTVPGVATVVASTLEASLPELGHYSNRAISAMVGIAPMADDSGRHHGQRHITGGRALPRTALYHATLSGLRFNPVLKALYARLKAKGKPSKVAMTACMRHLLCMINAMARDQTPWNPRSAHAQT